MPSLDEAIDAPAADPLDAAIDGVAQDRPRLRASLYGAVKQNPDEFARATQLSRSTGLPAPVVARNLPQVEQRSKLDNLDAAIDRGTALAVKMESGDFAALAHDDVDSLGAIERTINRRSAGKIGGPAFVRPAGTMRPSQGPEASFVSALSGVFGALPQGAEATRQGLRAQFADVIGSPSMSADALRRYQSAQSETFLSTPSFKSDTARGVYSGLSSLVRQVPGLAASIATRSPIPGLAGIGVQTEAEAYAKYRARGATGGQALLGGVGEGVVEVGTELLPMGFLVSRFGKAGAGEFLAGMLAREIPTEQIATLVQDAIDTAVANPDKTWQQYAAERPGAAYQTLVATVTQAGAMGAINEVARRVAGPSTQAATATQDAEALAQLSQLAAASKLRTRDPQSFQEFVQAANEDGPVQDIYLDARTLQQSGVDVQALAQASPAVAAQIEQALATGADLVIPVAEYAARLAGTDLDPLLTPHLRTAEDALSLDEAQRFYQGQADQFKQAAAQVMEEKATDDAWQQSAKVVEDDIFNQMQTAKRFTADKNRADAVLVREIFSVWANRLGKTEQYKGMTPEDAYKMFALRVGAKSPGGTASRMDQGVETPAFKAWFGESKVVDAQGKPLVVYHGSKTGGLTHATSRFTFFTADPAAASTYALDNGDDSTDEDSIVNPVYVRMTNPLVVDAAGEEWMRIPFEGARITTDTLAREAKRRGHDGLIVRNVVDNVNYEELPPSDVYVTLGGKAQIKSAIGNNGEFNPNDPNILKQEPNPLQRFAQSIAQALGIQTQQAEPVEQADTGGPALDMGQFFQGQGNRGEIAFGRDITQTPSVITLFNNADLSTFLHEMGHFQLEVLANIAGQPNAPAEIVQDMERVLKWFGIRGDEDVAGGETAGSLGQPGTDAFNNWFGGSKVVDAEGKPLITHHSGSFNENEDGAFNTENGVHFGTKAAALERIVGKAIDDEAMGAEVFEEGGRYYLDENDWPNTPESGFRTEADARTWVAGEVSENYQPDDYEPDITTVYLSIRNPKRVEDQGQAWGAAVAQAKAEGHDGIVYRNKFEDKGRDSWIVFKPTQIKSVNNAGTYDPNDPNILRQGDDQTTPDPTNLPKRRTALEVWQAMSLEEKRPYHEMFARGFEAYLFEGKAPSQELTGLFARFRAWLINVYKSVKALNVEISDDIRGVFDRLVATDEAIKQAEAARSYGALFLDDPETQALAAEATQTAVDGLQKRSLRDMQWLTNARGRILKQLQADAKEKRKSVEAEVRAEVDAMPVYAVQRFLKRGEMVAPDGEQIKVEKGHRLDTAALAEMYPETMLARPALERLQGMTRKDGLAPDTVAEMFDGFTSGDQLVREILAAAPHAEMVEGMTDQRMLERYGDLANPDTLARAADEAIHNEARLRVLATELQAATQSPGPVRAIMQAAKQYAERVLAAKKLKDIKPRQHAAAETRAGKAAMQAFGKGDTATLATEKRNQVLQGYLTKMSYEALDEVEKAVKYLRKFDSEGTRKNLDTEYVDQIDQLLERFDLRASVSSKAAAKRESLLAWVESQRDQGFEPDIPPDLITEALRKPYKELTLEELRGVVDTVKQIEHLGRLKQKLLTAKDEREFKAIRDEIAASIEANAKGTRDLRTRETTGAMLTEAGNRFLAMHRKMASVAREMDGFADGGPMWEYFIRSMNEAGDRETTRRAEATARLYTLVKPLTATGKMGGKGQYFETLGGSYNREERIAIALNLGNAGNMQRMLDGEGWTLTRLQPLLDTITPQEADFVQAVWDFFESYRPEIGAKERRIYGKEPEWVEPQPITLGGKTLKGGYYPIKYDPARSGRAEAFADAESAKAQMRGAYTTATTRRSFTKARAGEVTGRPLRYSFAGLYQGTNEVIHDLSWHEWLIDVNRLLRSLDSPIRTHYGAETVGIFKKAIEDIAAGDVPAQNVFERGLNHVRTGATIAGLGWNLMTALLQPIGLTQSAVRVGPGWVAKGMSQWIKAPLATVEEIKSKSAMMTSRAQTMQREINEIQNQVRGSKLDPVRATFFVLIQKMQMVADVPTWLGAYEKATAAGEAEDRATALADQAVLDAQGGGQMKDLSQIQRGHPALKLFTNFYSFFNVAYNLGVEKTKEKISTPKLYPSLALDYLLLYVLPAAFVTVMRDALLGGDDDEDKLVKKIIADQISYLLGLMVGLREITAAAQKVAGVEQFKGSYGGPAGLRLFQEIDKLGQQIGQGEADMALFKAADNVGGVIFHYPSGQVNRSVDGVAALIEGKTSNPLSAVIGPPKP